MTRAELASLTAALDNDELALAAHIHISELPLVTAARALGWTVHRVDRVRKRLQRKLDKFARASAPPSRRMVDDPPQHSYPQFFERLSSGRRLWSMRTLPRTYIDVVMDETPIVEFSNQLNSNKVSRTLNSEGANMKPIEALKKELTSEQAKLQRIDERVHKCHVAVDAADRALSAAQAELKRDQVQSVLEERESPNPELKKKLIALQNTLHHVEAEVAGAQEARGVQAGKVDAIAGEVEARTLEAQRISFAPAMRELYTAFGVMMAASAKVSSVLGEQPGAVDLTEILFPLKQIGGHDPIDYGKMELRNVLMGMYNLANNARKSRGAYDPKAELAA